MCECVCVCRKSAGKDMNEQEAERWLGECSTVIYALTSQLHLMVRHKKRETEGWCQS